MVRTIPPYPTSHSLSFNEVQLKTMQAKIFKTLKKSQPQMEIYWLLQKTGAEWGLIGGQVDRREWGLIGENARTFCKVYHRLILRKIRHCCCDEKCY